MKCDISSCNYFFKALKSTKYCNHLLLLFILTLKNKVFSFAIPTLILPLSVYLTVITNLPHIDASVQLLASLKTKRAWLMWSL